METLEDYGIEETLRTLIHVIDNGYLCPFYPNIDTSSVRHFLSLSLEQIESLDFIVPTENHQNQ